MSLLKKPLFALKLLRATGIAALTGFVFSSVASADEPRIIEGQALVRWHTLALAEGLTAPNEKKESNPFRQWANRIIASKLEKTFKEATVKDVFPNVGWALVEFPKSVKTDIGVAKLRSAFGSGNAFPNTLIKPTAVPNDTDYGSQWWHQKLKSPFAWDASTGSANVVVAVLDSGSQLNNADLKANLWKNSGEIAGDGIDNDNNGYVDDVYGINTVNLPDYNEYERGQAPNDTYGHGTHVAGIIGAVGNNTTGVSGVNWNVRIMSLRFLGDSGYGSEVAVIEAIDYILMMKKRGVNIRVTNNSWSGETRSSVIEDAFRKLNTAKILNICASGNDGYNTDTRPSYPASYNNTGIISVAASDKNDGKASFSNYGKKSVDLAAPGVDILSLGLTSSSVTMDGTSMATPMVTGAAALLLATQPNLSVSSLRSKLLACVDAVPALKGVVVTGGRLNLARLMGQSRVDISGLTFYKAKVAKKTVSLPLAGVEIQAINSKTKAVVTTYSNSSGAFTFTDLPIASYKFTPILTGYKFSAKSVTLKDKKVPSAVSLEGKPPTSLYTISGQAFDVGGSTKSGVDIYVNNSTVPIATTNASGAYSITDRGAGTYKLSAKSLNTEWTASTNSVSLPAINGNNAPNATVNFNAVSTDNEAPTVIITTPNLSAYSTGPITAVGTAVDETGLATLYFTLERTINSQISYYNWTSGQWTNDFADDGTIKPVAKSGKTASWSISLPAQASGATYRLKAWGVDTYGNETAIGAETNAAWSISSPSQSSGSTSSSASVSAKTSIKKF